MEKALRSIREENLSIRRAGRNFGIPESTLRDKIHERVPDQCRSGPSTVLSSQEETDLCVWLQKMSEIGYGRCRRELVEIVKKTLDKVGRVTCFKDNRPGKDWCASFKKRHHQLKLKTGEDLSRERALCCTPEAIESWFIKYQHEVEKVPGGSDTIKDPHRVWNAEESGFILCPQSEKIIGVAGLQSGQ